MVTYRVNLQLGGYMAWDYDDDYDRGDEAYDRYNDGLDYFWRYTFKDERFEDKSWDELTQDEIDIVKKEYNDYLDAERSYNDLWTTPR